jgi:hypothetical protein
MKGHVAALIIMALAVLVAVIPYRMPVSMALAATSYGFLYGVWPISWIIVAAMFLYKLTVKRVSSRSSDPRCCPSPPTRDSRWFWWASASAPSWKGPPASGRPSRLPRRCWSAWDLIPCTRRVCV